MDDTRRVVAAYRARRHFGNAAADVAAAIGDRGHSSMLMLLPNTASKQGVAQRFFVSRSIKGSG